MLRVVKIATVVLAVRVAVIRGILASVSVVTMSKVGWTVSVASSECRRRNVLKVFLNERIDFVGDTIFPVNAFFV